MIADRNKFAVAICAAAMSFPYITEGLSGVLGGLQETFPVSAVISMVSGLLMLFSGVVILSQKEVRFGGSLCIYSIVIEWTYNIYRIVNEGMSVDLWHIFFGVATLSVFIWSYGYKSDAPIDNLKKILHIVTFVIAGFVAIQAVIFVAKNLPMIFLSR